MSFALALTAVRSFVLAQVFSIVLTVALCGEYYGEFAALDNTETAAYAVGVSCVLLGTLALADSGAALPWLR